MEHETTTNTTLQALWLSMEQACAGYLIARKAMITLAVRVESLGQLAVEQPSRTDYRAAWDAAADAHAAATRRTDAAYQGWHRAQERYDAAWTATEGRQPRCLAARTATPVLDRVEDRVA
jgi:hypothetical protein